LTHKKITILHIKGLIHGIRSKIYTWSVYTCEGTWSTEFRYFLSRLQLIHSVVKFL